MKLSRFLFLVIVFLCMFIISLLGRYQPIDSVVYVSFAVILIFSVVCGFITEFGIYSISKLTKLERNSIVLFFREFLTLKQHK